jgi:hypothetical protein
VPAPDGSGVATLTQVRTAADPFKPLALDPKLPYDVTADRAKQAQVFISAPLSSLTPRMRFLQAMAPESAGARLAADPKAVRERFQRALSGVEVRFWNPPVIDALPRVLFTFLPPNEGGGDPSPAGRRRLDRYYYEAVPWGVLPKFLLELQGEPGARIKAAFADRVGALAKPGGARDLILRGQYAEATEQLVAVQTKLQQRPKSVQDVEQNTKEWAETSVRFYADLSRLERAAAKGDPAAIPNLEEARRRVDNLWKLVGGPMAYLDYLTNEPLAVEATYLLAVCKHEQAERGGHQPDAATDKAAWQSAQRWWNTFLGNYPDSPAAPAARRNLARALEASGQAVEARAAYEAVLTSNLSPLEKLACKYRASRLSR